MYQSAFAWNWQRRNKNFQVLDKIFSSFIGPEYFRASVSFLIDSFTSSCRGKNTVIPLLFSYLVLPLLLPPNDMVLRQMIFEQVLSVKKSVIANRPCSTQIQRENAS